MITTDLIRSFRYDAWANRRMLQALRQLPHLEERSRQIMTHLLTAQKVWLRRLRGEDASALPIWPDPAIEEWDPLLADNEQGYRQLLASLPPQRLGELITYRTSNGLQFSTAVTDILTQVLLHGSYHRGQLAAAIKRQGGDPPLTEYIIFARES